MKRTIGGTCLLAMSVSTLAWAGTNINTEAVSDFGGGGDIPNAVPNCDGFRNKMLASGTPFTAGDAWVNQDVWDSDFVDPEAKAGGDDSYFDSNGDAISYFCGHGTDSNGIPKQRGFAWEYCSTSANCTNPPSGFANPGVCRFVPNATQSPPVPAGKGICTYRTPRAIVVNGAQATFGNWVKYSEGFSKFGESSTSGSWGGGGTNGGVNLVVLDLSNGVLPGFEVTHLDKAFAGVHFLATLMPVTGDTAMINGRGLAFANRFWANQSATVTAGWRDTLFNLSASSGSPCGYASGDGGRGFNGCGCHVIMNRGRTLTESESRHDQESWTRLRTDSSATSYFGDVKGNAWWTFTVSCNFDFVAHPIVK